MTISSRISVKKAYNYIELLEKCENHLEGMKKSANYFRKQNDFYMMRWYEERCRILERSKSRIESRINNLLKQSIQ